MHVRTKSKAPAAVGHADPVVVQFQESVRALTETWDAMVWLNTTNLEVNARRREIAAWGRNANQSLADTFGREVDSDEIRVLFTEMPHLVPRAPGDRGRLLLAVLASEARVLADRGRTAVEALHPSVTR
ncbi:MAG TPA: hypothetical protein VFT62_05340 [Mycobacteriales bacterium]|nr:hypothetical protein [Mycobacteriales bacterium]